MHEALKATAASPALERTYTFLRSEILSGRYPAGLRIKQEEIARTLGLSRIPVRDAIQRLLAEGFVTLQPDRGVVVTRLTAEDISELFEIRAALEALAVQLSAPRVEATFLADSEEILNRMGRARGDISLWIKRHEEFHEQLAAPCNRPRLAAQARHYRQMVEPYVRFYVTTHHDPEMEGAEHRGLLETMKMQNPEFAREAMTAHVTTAAQRVIDYIARANPPGGGPER